MPERLYPNRRLRSSHPHYTAAEGGRRSPLFNGIRWDFAYAEQQPPDTLYMIWPDFIDDSGNSLSQDAPLPVGIELPARMMIVVQETRDQFNRVRISPGVRFFCHEGGKRVAEGVVTRVTVPERECQSDGADPPAR